MLRSGAGSCAGKGSCLLPFGHCKQQDASQMTTHALARLMVHMMLLLRLLLHAHACPPTGLPLPASRGQQVTTTWTLREYQ